MPLLNERRRKVYPALVVTVAAVWLVLGVTFFWIQAARSGAEYGGDFNTFWSAAELTDAGEPEAAYDYERLLAQERVTRPDTGLYPFNYPPVVLVALRPLALLPFGVALAAWTLLSLAILASVLHLLRAATLPVFAISMVPVTANALFGQNGLITGAILTGGLALLDRRPLLAGLVLGLLSYKPHFLPVVVLALLVMQKWRALSGVLGSSVGLVCVGFLFAGADSWRGFVEGISNSSNSLHEPGAWEKMTSVLAMLRLLGASKEVAQIGHVIGAVGVVAAVIWAVRQPCRAEYRNAVIVIASLMVTPYSFVYDLALVAPALGWFVVRDRRTTRTEAAVFATFGLMPLVLWGFAERTGLLLSPLVLLALLVVNVRRIRAEPRLRGIPRTSVASPGTPSIPPGLTSDGVRVNT